MTPLYDALVARAARNTLRCHMPGHAGHAVIPEWDAICALDFTELPGAGNLYADGDDGPIRAAERLYAQVYGAEACLFLTGGATQGLLAMLSAFARPGDTVILDRNSHISVHNALALMDLRPVWVQSSRIEPFGVTAGLPAGALAYALAAHPDAVCVLVTSPTYYGVLSDLPALAAVCAAHPVPLLVDAAHGAHLPFLDGFSSPVAQGASAAVLSAHKTLPALGQSAFLLTGRGVSSPLLRGRAALFGSSSPSYVLMASLDVARAYMEGEGREALQKVARAAEEIRQSSPLFLGYNGNDESTNGAPGLLRPTDGTSRTPSPTRQLLTLNSQLSTLEVDPLRLCLYTGDGHAAAQRLERADNIVCEMSDPRNVVLILSVMHAEDDLMRLKTALESVLPPPPHHYQPQIPNSQLSALSSQLSPKQALFAPRVSLPWREALGRVAAEPVGPYPPGAPAVARGEEIDADIMAELERAGFEGNIWVIHHESLLRGVKS